MAAFDFVALDATGREQRGVLEGDSPRQIRQLLRERGLLPVSVEPVAAMPRNRPRGAGVSLLHRWRERIGAADVALITRQLATLVRAALPLPRGRRPAIAVGPSGSRGLGRVAAPQSSGHGTPAARASCRYG